jgi:hypothetical protein
MEPSDFTTTSLGRLRRRPWKLLATTVRLPSSSWRVTRRVVLAGQQPALEVAGEPVGPVGLLLEYRDALAWRVLHPLAGVDVAEQEIAAFLPPQRSLGRPQRAAKAAAHFDDGLIRRKDAIKLRRELLDALGGLRRGRADSACRGEATCRGHGQHAPARDRVLRDHDVSSLVLLNVVRDGAASAWLPATSLIRFVCRCHEEATAIFSDFSFDTTHAFHSKTSFSYAS